jgi:hypothetical protein
MEPISSVIVAPTAERKTAPSGFAVTLRSALAGALRGVALGVAAGSRASPGGTPAAAAGPSSPAGGDAFEAARLLQAEGQSFNLRYLELQERLQRESREFTAMSNVMKVRHDAARAAIQNVQ